MYKPDHRTLGLTLGVIAGLLCAIGASSPGNAQSSAAPTSFPELAKYRGADREKVLYEGAKKEGKVVWYTSVVIDMDQELVKGFKARYPGIDVDVYAATDTNIMTRLLTEYKAGRHDVDSLSMGGSGPVIVDAIGGQVWDSPHLDDYPVGDLGRSLDGKLVTILQFGRVLAYNTKLVAPKDVPTKWEDLLKPYWKGKLVLVTGPGVIPVMIGGLINEWGKEKAVDYMKKLGQQNVTILGSSPAAVTGMVGSGDFLGTYGAIHRVTILQKAGAPLGAAVLGDTVFTQIQTIQLPPTPAHPYAALLWTDFLTSAKDGQTIFKDFGYPPTNPKVATNDGPLAGHKNWVVTNERLEAGLPEWTAIQNEAFR